MDFPRGDKSPSSDALLPVDTREKTVCGKESTDNRQRPVSANKMAYARRTIVVLFLCMLVLLGVASGTGMPCHKAATNQQQDAVKASESSSFSTALKSASPASLHELLHRFLPDRFKDGVFPSDHQAMEAVHRADAALATSILQLAKRQDSNATASDDSETPAPTETEPETSEPPTETSDPPTEPTDPPTETTTSTTDTPPTTSSTSVEPTTSSSEPPVSSSSTTPSSTSSSSSVPGTSLSSTSETTFSPTSSSSSETETSSSVPDTTLTTSTVPPPTTKPPPSTSKEITTTYTTTSPDGDVVTVTAVTYVPVNPGETAAPETTHSPPTLQNSAIRGYSSGSVLTGAVVLAMVLLMV